MRQVDVNYETSLGFHGTCGEVRVSFLYVQNPNASSGPEGGRTAGVRQGLCPFVAAFQPCSSLTDKICRKTPPFLQQVNEKLGEHGLCAI